MPITRCDGHLFTQALRGSLEWLTVNRDEVDALNVFPVPDGDTGTNMLLTLKSAVLAISDLDEAVLGSVAKKAAHGALMGARGNSGVILSQIFRGIAGTVAMADTIDARGLAAALVEGAAVAYRAVIKPTEGTMLTVARAAGEAARARAAETDDLAAVVGAAAEAARVAVEHTPEQLPILRQAGVVDAGGYGLQIILEGFLKRLNGDQLAAFREAPVRHARPRKVEAPEAGWGYCTEFVINGEGLPLEAVRSEIARRGQSALVVGDESTIKVHVHTQEPADIIAYAGGLGVLTRLKVDDMSAQHHRVQLDGASSKHLALVAVASGDGFRRILEGLGVDAVVSGGQTANPSTEDLLAAVESAPSDDVLLLPNNSNVILAAQQVPALTRKRVRVVPSRSIPQGIAALLAFEYSADLAANAGAMEAALRDVQTVEITHAVRPSELEGLSIAAGDVIGLLNDRMVAVGADRAAVCLEVLERLPPNRVQVITVYAGEQAPQEESEALARTIGQRFPHATVELQSGGQALYPYVLAVE